MWRFYTKGVFNGKPGVLTESGSKQRAILNSLPITYPGIVGYNQAVFPVNAVSTVTYTNIFTQFQQQALVEVGAVADLRNILSQLQSQLASVNFVQITATNFNVFANEAGSNGNFSFNINGSINNGAVATNVIWPAGRIVVPDNTNVDYAQRNYDRTPRYRLPAIGDNANLLEQAVLTCLDHGSNYSRLLLNFSGNQTPGTVRAGLESGTMLVDPITAINGSAANYFVETSNAGINLAGKITTTPTGTTLALPIGKIFVKSGTNTVGQLAEIQIKQ